MPLKTTLIAGLLCIAMAAQGAPPTPPRSTAPEVPLMERTARIGVKLEEPKDLYQIKMAIQHSFAIKLSTEPLPKKRVGAVEVPLEPFAIVAGERFDAVIDRLEEAAQGRWIFEEDHGVPLLRLNSSFEGYGTLLDTVISVDIKASSMWEALCALARAVNRENGISAPGSQLLLIWFGGPGLLIYPPAIFLEKKDILITLDRVPAREGLCAIFEQMGGNIRYLYHRAAKSGHRPYDYVTITAFDDNGKVIDGGRMYGGPKYERLKTEPWMGSDEAMLAIQVPKPNGATGPK